MIDPFGREVTYLRVSVTDRCDFRCVYCMSENMTFLPKADVLSLEELDRLSSAFVRNGVKKLRLTGGEPLVRRNIMSLFRSLSRHLQTGAASGSSQETIPFGRRATPRWHAVTTSLREVIRPCHPRLPTRGCSWGRKTGIDCLESSDLASSASPLSRSVNLLRPSTNRPRCLHDRLLSFAMPDSSSSTCVSHLATRSFWEGRESRSTPFGSSKPTEITSG